jgi:hypothetical protein
LFVTAGGVDEVVEVDSVLDVEDEDEDVGREMEAVL